MQAVCQCGAIKIELPAAQPSKLYHCHCSHCRKQSGSAFGTSAVFPDFHMPVTAQPIGVWTRETFDPGVLKDCYFCLKCGVRIGHRSRGIDEPREERDAEEGKEKYKVNPDRIVTVRGGCLSNLDWSKGVHIYCGDAVTNLEFPNDVEKYIEDDNGPRWEKQRVW